MNIISLFHAKSIGLAMQGTYSWPEWIGMGLIGLAVLIGVVALLVELLSREEPFEIGLSARPLPNILLGWVLLWLMGALLVTIYPFPTRAAMTPQRSRPPYMEIEVTSSEAGGEEPSVSAEDMPAAELLVNNGCGGCHAIQGVEGMAGVVGPDLSQIGANAAQRLEDPAYTGSATTVEAYIHESIVQSDLFVVEDYPAGVMPLTFADTLSPEELDIMVNFLASRQ